MIVGDLEAAHVPRISRILEAVLVALEEKLQLEPATILIEEHSGPEGGIDFLLCCDGVCQGTPFVM